jgi:hypothetical protein
MLCYNQSLPQQTCYDLNMMKNPFASSSPLLISSCWLELVDGRTTSFRVPSNSTTSDLQNPSWLVANKVPTENGKKSTHSDNNNIIIVTMGKDVPKPGQKFPTPTPGFGDRVFYETLFRQRPKSAMAQEWCVWGGI